MTVLGTPKRFTRRGWEYKALMAHDRVYMYQVSTDYGIPHYEVFEARVAPVCIDFENRVYSDATKKHSYPRDNDFGKTAWCYRSKQKAMSKTLELIYNANENSKRDN